MLAPSGVFGKYDSVQTNVVSETRFKNKATVEIPLHLQTRNDLLGGRDDIGSFVRASINLR